jgi:hypothetical protein
MRPSSITTMRSTHATASGRCSTINSVKVAQRIADALGRAPAPQWIQERGRLVEHAQRASAVQHARQSRRRHSPALSSLPASKRRPSIVSRPRASDRMLGHAGGPRRADVGAIIALFGATLSRTVASSGSVLEQHGELRTPGVGANAGRHRRSGSRPDPGRARGRRTSVDLLQPLRPTSATCSPGSASVDAAQDRGCLIGEAHAGADE